MIDKETKIYGSFAAQKGNFGVHFYNKYFTLEKINSLYIPFQSTSAKNVVTAIKELNFSSASISMPFKQDIIQYLNDVADQAKGLNAVNTVLNQNHKLVGYNTDAIAVKHIISTNYKLFKKNHISIFGHGAIASMVVKHLTAMDIQEISIFGRNEQKIKKFCLHHQINNSQRSHPRSILINCSPIGMKFTEMTSPFPQDIVKDSCFIWDFINNPRETELIKMAKKYHRPYCDGNFFSSIQIQNQLKFYLNINKTSLDLALDYALKQV